MMLTFKTDIPFRPRQTGIDGEQISVRDGTGRVVEVWECLSARDGVVTFRADGYRAAGDL